MVKIDYGLSIKKKMNMEQKAIMELLDKILFIKFTDEEKLKHLEYIKACRLRYFELEKQFQMEKQKGNKKIENYYHVPASRHSNI